jgi:hypothetical protein
MYVYLFRSEKTRIAIFAQGNEYKNVIYAKNAIGLFKSRLLDFAPKIIV